MKKIIIITLLSSLFLSSCVSKKEFTSLQSKLADKEQELVDVTASLQKCLVAKKGSSTESAALKQQILGLKNRISDLKDQNKHSVKQIENLTILTQGASDNIKTVIAQLSEKDKYINGIRGAMSQKDSINLAVAFHLKRELADGMQDEDIQINVEKTVVYISLSDKLMFSSGGFTVSKKAKQILGKVATVIQDRPEMQVMVEGHTDNVGINKACMKDNWDLSAKRATAVVRVLQDLYKIDPSRLVASARSEFDPLESNDTKEGRARNRRTKIIILPKLDEFFEILEKKPE